MYRDSKVRSSLELLLVAIIEKSLMENEKKKKI